MLPHKTIRGRSRRFGYATITGISAVAAAVAIPTSGLDVSTSSFWWIAVASLAVIGSLVASTGVWTVTGAYAAVFWCFHFGLIAVLAGGLVDATDLSRWDQAWVLGPFAADAAVLALVGSLAFASGASFVQARRSATASQATPNAPVCAHPHGTAGAVLVLAAIAFWGGVVVSTSGTAGFFASYGDYLQATAGFNTAMSYVWVALGCGVVLVVTGRPGWLRTGALVGCTCFAVIALPLGLRGEVMFPTIAALVASARCGRVLSPMRACAVIVGLLVLIPIIREVRATGVQNLTDVVLESRLFDALVEMGGSLHPVEKVVRWRWEGEPLEKGSSYWAPIERAAARILPGVQAAAAHDDMRIMNVLVTDRVGAIGFSPVAEAYRNFGAAGVVVVLGLLGAALAAMDTIRDRRIAVLAIATVYVPLLTNVRNSFISVPAQCAAGILFVLVLVALRHMAGSTVARPYARSPYISSEI